MDAVLFLSGLSLMLCGWVLYLQNRLRLHKDALEGLLMVVYDVANEKAVIEKLDNGYRVRSIKNEKDD